MGGPSFLGPVQSHKGLKSDLWASIIRPCLASGVPDFLSWLMLAEQSRRGRHFAKPLLNPCSDPHCKPLAGAPTSPFSNEETEAQEGTYLRSLSWEGIKAGFKPRPWQLQPPEANHQALSISSSVFGTSSNSEGWRVKRVQDPSSWERESVHVQWDAEGSQVQAWDRVACLCPDSLGNTEH